MELTTTYHMVDDEPTPQDLAMDIFRSHFHLVANCNVESDGRIMWYRLTSKAQASVWERSANKIIKAHNLPLIARVDVWKSGDIFFEVSLNIIYNP